MAYSNQKKLRVLVKFQDPIYNHERELSGDYILSEVQRFLEGARVNVAKWPDENFQLVVGVEKLDVVTEKPTAKVKIKEALKVKRGLMSHEEYLKLNK